MKLLEVFGISGARHIMSFANKTGLVFVFYGLERCGCVLFVFSVVVA